MSEITVRIDSSRPIFIEADADNFGQVFANMSDEDQVNVLRAMVEHTKPHRVQWDYIAIALEKDENREVRDHLSVIFPDTNELVAALAAKDSEIAQLREALMACEKQAEEIRLIFLTHLDEPERSAFWKAVNIREFARAALTQPDAKSGEKDGQ